MKRFRDLPIKWKLNILIILTCTVGLSVLGTAFFHMYRRQSWDASLLEVRNTARLLAASSDSALDFDDPGAAAQLLGALGADAGIEYAGILDRDGRLFAEYRPRGRRFVRPGAAVPEKAIDLDKDFLNLQEPVVLQGERIGSVFIVHDMTEAKGRLAEIARTTFLIILAVWLLVVLLTNLLQREFVQPLAELAKTAGAISRNKDYSLRVPSGSRDEIGTLIQSFNTMVSEIQRRDESLEELVNSRTGELLQANEGLRREMQERIKAEKRIFASLREKEVLLKEVHHRVKNNLTVISSLLGLQAEQVPSAPLREALETCRQRIRTMAAVHSFLYASDNLARVDFGEYLRSLVGSLKGSVLSAGPDAPGVRIRAEHAFLNLETAVPCGLIVNELITNALKHAFVRGRKGEIVVSFRQEEQKQYCLEVADDGVGLPAGVACDTAETLGLKIVSLLTVQLRGSLEIRRNPGTRFTITFCQKNKRESDYASI